MPNLLRKLTTLALNLYTVEIAGVKKRAKKRARNWRNSSETVLAFTTKNSRHAFLHVVVRNMYFFNYKIRIYFSEFMHAGLACLLLLSCLDGILFQRVRRNSIQDCYYAFAIDALN
jgi:hypothetical protein